MARVTLDASVVIAFLDARDAHHERARAALSAHRADELILPASAYAETLVAPCRRGATAIHDAETALGALAVRIAPLTAEIAREAAALRARHDALQLGDALVLATGLVLDADIVLTADRSWRRVSPRVQLV